MNYEQKYKEALERVRELMTNQNPPAFDKHLIETVFPELAENEDERIRKGIIALIEFGLDDKSAIAPGYNITKEEAIAWLEKQGKKLDADKVIDWLRFHIQVDDPKIEYNEDGQPLAESFIAHAKARCVAADEVVKKFKQDFGL